MPEPSPTSSTATVDPVAATPRRPVKMRHHFAQAVRFNPAEISGAMKEVEGVNAKIAVLVTKSVGTMWMAYIFSLLALMSLPAILIEAGVLSKGDVPHFLTKPGLILIVAWIAQTFIQLVLLSIIMVGQDVQSIAADARSENTFTDTQAILDAMNTETAGGLRTILEAVEAQTKVLAQAGSGDTPG